MSAHARALTFGGLDGIPNLSLVESAIARPYNGYYPHLWQKAAALVQSMATNHGFADGNKRTTLILLYTLVQNSGYDLVAIDNENKEDAVENIILAVVNGSASFDELANWLKARVVRRK